MEEGPTDESPMKRPSSKDEAQDPLAQPTVVLRKYPKHLGHATNRFSFRSGGSTRGRPLEFPRPSKSMGSLNPAFGNAEETVSPPEKRDGKATLTCLRSVGGKRSGNAKKKRRGDGWAAVKKHKNSHKKEAVKNRSDRFHLQLNARYTKWPRSTRKR